MKIATTRRPRGLTVALIAAAVGTSLMLSGCSSSSTPSSSETPAADELKEFNLPATAYNGAIPFYPLAVAESLGFFEKHGLKPTIMPVGGGGESVRAFTADPDAAMGAVGLLAALPAIDQGEDLLIFGQVSAIQDTFIATKANGPATPQDLRGKKIGASRPGSSLEAAAINFLESEGMTKEDVEIVYLGSMPDLQVALDQGIVDAIAGTGILTATQKVDVDKEWKMFGEFGEYSPGAAAAYVAKGEVAENDPEMLDSFGKARAEAIQYIKDNPEDEQLVQIMQEWYGSTDPALTPTYQSTLKYLSENADAFFGKITPDLDLFDITAEDGVAQGALTSAPTSWDKYVVSVP